MRKDIQPYNDKGQRHGLWEWYYSDGQLWYKCFFHNGRKVGYEVDYEYITDKLMEKKYHI